MDTLIGFLYIYILFNLGMAAIGLVVFAALNAWSTEDWVRHYYDMKRKRAEEWNRWNRLN